ncbi:MAG: zinc/manganese transport system permease protein [Solirubrobacteraceae bacterium]|nr:zinc/manganese transport system permease protein [Solirubrobacteraceae bacterium]
MPIRTTPTGTVRTPADAAHPTLSWNVAHDVAQVLEYHFMLNALLAGSVVAVMAGLVGWLMVLRREAFAGHTLSMMAFPGASAAALAAVPAAWGYFLFCAVGATAMGWRSGAGRRVSWSEQSASIGAVQALALAAGFLFVSLYGGVLGDLENLLFGDLLGVSDGEVLLLVAVAAGTLAALAALGRPLLFASVDADVAQARGVPVRALSLAFLLLLGLAVAATSQITGVLLVFALLVAPAASAQALTARPLASLVLSVALGLLVVWLGLGLAYFSIYPAGFFLTTVAFAIYVLARLISFAAGRTRARGAPADAPAQPTGVID